MPGDLFPPGETVVRYTATDPSGNNRTCEIHIVIKGILFLSPQKPSGHLVCGIAIVNQSGLGAVDL